MARMLLTTRCRDSGLYDYFRENAPQNFRWRFGMPRRISFGLRFTAVVRRAGGQRAMTQSELC